MHMITSQIKELAATREKLAQLERAVEAGLRQELSGLHEEYGFADVESFLEAVKSAAGGGGRGKGRKAKNTPKAAAAPKTRKRAVITAATHAQVKKLVEAGKSGSQIAKMVGISPPSVQNIKKALGLVKSRGAKAKKATSEWPRAALRTMRSLPALR